MVLLLLVGAQRVPPLPQDLADCPVVLVGMSLVHQGPVALTEDHEGIHGSADVVFIPLDGDGRGGRNSQLSVIKFVTSKRIISFVSSSLRGGLTFLSPSLGRALSDCVRLFVAPAEGARSFTTPGENLHSPKKWRPKKKKKERKEGNRDSQQQMGKREISHSDGRSGKQQGYGAVKSFGRRRNEATSNYFLPV